MLFFKRLMLIEIESLSDVSKMLTKKHRQTFKKISYYLDGSNKILKISSLKTISYRDIA